MTIVWSRFLSIINNMVVYWYTPGKSVQFWQKRGMEIVLVGRQSRCAGLPVRRAAWHGHGVGTNALSPRLATPRRISPWQQMLPLDNHQLDPPAISA